MQTLTKADKIYLIIGQDNLEKIHLWQDYEKLKQMVHFVVATRGEEKPIFRDFDFIQLKIDVPISSSQIRKDANFDFVPATIKKEVEKIFKDKN